MALYAPTCCESATPSNTYLRLSLKVRIFCFLNLLNLILMFFLSVNNKDQDKMFTSSIYSPEPKP